MTSEVLGNAVIPVRAVLDKLDGDLAEARRKVEASTATMSSKMQKAGGALTRSLTPAAVGIGLASRQAFGEWDSGADALSALTGAVGDELAGLESSMKRVAGNATQGLGEVGQVMGELSAKTGLTGEPLEALTQRLLALDEIGNGVSAESITRMFGDWSVATEDQSDALDRLFRVSQATGVPIEKISDLMTRSGGPLRQLGFEYDEAAALMARFEKEGVNTELVMSGMKQALGNFAKAGVDPAAAFDELVTSIKSAGSAGEANAIALKAMGVEAGPDFAAAVREGRFELDDYTTAMTESEATVLSAAESNRSLGDKLAVLKNRATAIIGPFGEVGMAIGGVGAAIGPTVSGLGKIGPHAGKAGSKLLGIGKAAGSGLGKLASLGASGVSALGRLSASAVKSTATVVAQVGRQVGAWILLGVQSMAGAAKVAAAWLISMGPLLLVAAAVAGLVALIVVHWDTIKRVTAALWDGIKSGVSAAWEWIKGAIGAALDFLKTAFMNFTGPGLLMKHWDTIKAGIGAVKDFFVTTWNSVTSFFAGIPGAISSTARGMWDGIKDAFRSAVNFIIRGWNRIEFKIPGFKVGPIGYDGFTLGLPDIPLLAKGGTAATGGLSWVGERGPELTWLPKGASVMSNDRSSDLLSALGASGGSSSAEAIAVYVDGRELFEIVRDRQADSDARNGRGRRLSVR